VTGGRMRSCPMGDTEKTMPQSELRADELYQDEILPLVSRTFALTIPQLPDPLDRVVTNAYLLCRIADAIEDEAALGPAQKTQLHNRFIAVIDGNEDADAFGREGRALLTDSTIAPERDLVANTARVIRITNTFPASQRAALRGCINKMCRGMPEFQHETKHHGLATMTDMDRYCYTVAGVVGEMLTDLFCDYSDGVAAHHDAMWSLARSFGQGLQMVNILKDVWEDLERGFCWLPRDVFSEGGYDLRKLSTTHDRAAFTRGLETLIGVAHGHLRNALEYTLLVPPSQGGIRLFLLWSIGLAVLTLRRLRDNPNYVHSDQVKVSRRAVGGVVLATRATVRSDVALRLLFNMAARGLPLASQTRLEQDQAGEPRSVRN
jgi:farnesyl-diphosphate farnesyltransferase